MRNRVMLIACALLFAGVVTLYAQESQPMMTVEQTVAWAKSKSPGASGYFVEPNPRPNPAAREQLWGILGDKKQEASWQWVVYSFRFLGQTEDVPRIVRWVEGFRGESFTYSRVKEITDAENALGVMALRGVEGAQAALDKMMAPDYWRGLAVALAGHAGVDRTSEASFLLAMSATVAGVYTRDPDFKEKLKKIVEGISDPKERQAYSDRIKGAFDDYDHHMADGLLAGERLHLRLAQEVTAPPLQQLARDRLKVAL